jgi:transcriptional regulator with XRE-family HTH domain
MNSMKYAELGAFLRSRRERIRPEEVGLASGPRRRVPGLRREEVAQLAGASADYYNELERGAGSQPSEQMLAALARALRLTADERDHLYHLANRPVPRGGAGSHVHPGMLDLLTRLTSTPAQVITDLHVTLVQNPLAIALLGDHSHFRGEEASFVYRWFTDPEARRLYPEEDHPAQSKAFAADLRAAAARRDAGTPRRARSSPNSSTAPPSSPGCGPSTTWRSAATTASASTIPGSAWSWSTASPCSARTVVSACCGSPPRWAPTASTNWSCSLSSAPRSSRRTPTSCTAQRGCDRSDT